MVKVEDGGAWRAGLFFALLGLVGASNACGGRTVWLEEGSEGGDSGSGGVSGYGGGGDYGGGGYTGGYGGDYGGGGYGGDYGGGGYGGDYGGGGYTGGYGGTYGGSYGGGGYTGGVAGDYGGGGYTGGVAGKGGYGGTYGGTAGVAGKGGCGGASGTGGSAGSPALSKSCLVFCTRFPYATCPSAVGTPQECLGECQSGFGVSSWCQFELVNFLGCTGQALNPNAMCTDAGNGSCSGPGCLDDAVLACGDSYLALLECEATPRPIPPCPPPPDRPIPPNCGQSVGVGPDSCLRETSCPGTNQRTECYYQYDSGGWWACECSANGSITSVSMGNTSDPCASASATCGFY